MNLFRRIFIGPPRLKIGPGDRRAVALLRQAGADRDVPRVTRHFLYFASEADAHSALIDLARSFRIITVQPEIEFDSEAEGSRWLAIVHQALTLDLNRISVLRREFEAATSGPGADYEGWEATAANYPLVAALKPPAIE